MSNDSVRDDFGQVLALVQEQMRDLSEVQRQRSTMVARAVVADGAVEVTVNAERMVVKTVVDESYLEDHEFAELGGHITSAAQAAVGQLDQRSQVLLASMNERRKAVSEISGNVLGLPGFREVLAEVGAMGDGLYLAAKPAGDDGEGDSSFPMIRS